MFIFVWKVRDYMGVYKDMLWLIVKLNVNEEELEILYFLIRESYWLDEGLMIVLIFVN